MCCQRGTLLETCKQEAVLMQQAFEAALSALKANPLFEALTAVLANRRESR